MLLLSKKVFLASKKVVLASKKVLVPDLLRRRWCASKKAVGVLLRSCAAASKKVWLVCF